MRAGPTDPEVRHVLSERYIEQVEKVVRFIRDTQMEAIKKAALMMADSIADRHPIHVTGTGHSHILAEEMSSRAGGLRVMSPVLDMGYMVYGGARKSSRLERLPGFATAVIDNHDLRPGEILIIVSNSGKNQGPVEMALYAKEKRLKVIAVTSMQHTTAVPSEHPSGKRLFEIADLVIDNGSPLGDASVEIAPDLPKVGPLSTIACATVLNCIVCETAVELHARGIVPPIAVSGNVPRGQLQNNQAAPAFADVLERIKWR